MSGVSWSSRWAIRSRSISLRFLSLRTESGSVPRSASASMARSRVAVPLPQPLELGAHHRVVVHGLGLRDRDAARRGTHHLQGAEAVAVLTDLHALQLGHGPASGKPESAENAILRGPGGGTISLGRSPRRGRTPHVAFEDMLVTKPIFTSHPHLLGFDFLEQLAQRTAESGGGYPPFDIEALSDNAYRITVAVAGFAEGDLSITVEDRELVVRGQRPPEPEGRSFLHRGIAARRFRRSFVLADGVEAGRATLSQGLLHIDLERAVPETVVRRIPIATGGQDR